VSQTLHCVNHPNVETYLRCNRCGDPICSKCAVRTPVGYRCRKCVQTQQAVFYADFGPVHYLITVLVALPLSLVAGWLIPSLGWFAIILGPIAGSVIAQAVRWATRRRRGRYQWAVVCACIVVGALPWFLLSLSGTVLALGAQSGFAAFGPLLGLIWFLVYLVAAVGAAYGWLRPGRRV
jgi:hypothetical protein